MLTKCRICPMFDCGSRCLCLCHYGTANKIKHDLMPGDISQLQKFTENDVELVAQQANVTKYKARESLKKHKGDMARAILDLT